MKRCKILGVGLLLGVLAGLTACTGNVPGDKAKLKQQSFESAGFDTPEAAVESYLKSMSEEDIPGMISAYAIETYVEHHDFEKQLEHIQVYNVRMQPRVPNTNEFTQAFNVEFRRNSIVESIFYQMMVFTNPPVDLYQTTALKPGAEVEGFIEDFEDALKELDLSEFELIGFIDPADLHEVYESPKNQEVMNRMADIYDVDELKSVAAIFEVDKEIYLFCCNAAEYGERWYLHAPGGTIGNLLGISTQSAGMAPLSRSEYRELEDFIYD